MLDFIFHLPQRVFSSLFNNAAASRSFTSMCAWVSRYSCPSSTCSPVRDTPQQQPAHNVSFRRCDRKGCTSDEGCRVTKFLTMCRTSSAFPNNTTSLKRICTRMLFLLNVLNVKQLNTIMYVLSAIFYRGNFTHSPSSRELVRDMMNRCQLYQLI